MSKKDIRTPQRSDKKASASAAAGLLTAVSLLGVSLGASAAPTLDGAGPAAGAKSAAAGEKLAQSKQLKLFKQRPGESKIKLFSNARREQTTQALQATQGQEGAQEPLNGLGGPQVRIDTCGNA